MSQWRVNLLIYLLIKSQSLWFAVCTKPCGDFRFMLINILLISVSYLLKLLLKMMGKSWRSSDYPECTALEQTCELSSTRPHSLSNQTLVLLLLRPQQCVSVHWSFCWEKMTVNVFKWLFKCVLNERCAMNQLWII